MRGRPATEADRENLGDCVEGTVPRDSGSNQTMKHSIFRVLRSGPYAVVSCGLFFLRTSCRMKVADFRISTERNSEVLTERPGGPG